MLKSVTSQVPRRAVSHSRLLKLESRAARVAVAEPKAAFAGAEGWSEDQYKILFAAAEGRSGLEHGDDAPPAILSALPRPLWDYCKQRFAR